MLTKLFRERIETVTFLVSPGEQKFEVTFQQARALYSEWQIRDLPDEAYKLPDTDVNVFNSAYSFMTTGTYSSPTGQDIAIAKPAEQTPHESGKSAPPAGSLTHHVKVQTLAKELGSVPLGLHCFTKLQEDLKKYRVWPSGEGLAEVMELINLCFAVEKREIWQDVIISWIAEDRKNLLTFKEIRNYCGGVLVPTSFKYSTGSTKNDE